MASEFSQFFKLRKCWGRAFR